MKISVITVCYNASDTIRHTLDSFFAQDWLDKELIVIDGNSGDSTLDIITSYEADEIQIISEPDKGMYDAVNKGLRLFSGDGIGMLNADDAYHDNSVLTQIANSLEKVDIVHGHLNFVDDMENHKVVRRWHATERPKNGFASGWMPAHPTFYVRREVVQKVGEFDLSLPTASDYDWMLRAIEKHNFSMGLIDHVMINMTMGGRSTAGISAHISHNLEALHSRQKWLNAGLVDYALFAKPFGKIGQFLPSLSTG